jgi:hypothetical protein
LDSPSDVLSPKVSIVEDSDGFKTVTSRRKTATGAPAVVTVKHCRQPLVGVRNSISKKERFNTLFFSRFRPEVTDDVEESMRQPLCLKKLICTRLKNKFNTYASFHVSVIE